MPDSYQICTFYVLGETPSTRQFLEFCADSELSPPREVCITGNNGTGKSTLLSDLREHFAPASSSALLESPSPDSNKLIASKLLIDGETYYRITVFSSSQERTERTFTDTEPVREALNRIKSGQATLADSIETFFQREELETADFPKWETPLFFPVPADSGQSDSRFDLVRALNRNFADRRDQFLLFLAAGSTQEKKVSEAIAEFRENTPNPLEALATLWNEALESNAGLRFHSNTATFSFPGSNEAADFKTLSPALKLFLSRTGSLFLSLNSGKAKPSLVLIDEPEWGLTPALSAKCIEILISIAGESNIQLIFATKTPDIITSVTKANHLHLTLDDDGTRTAGFPAEPEIEKVEPDSEAPKNEAPSQRVNLAKLKRAIEATDDQDELANLVDELMSLRKL